MNNLKTGLRQRLILLIAIILSLIGLIFVFESSVAENFQDFGDPYLFVRQQSIWFGVGVIGMFICSFIPLNFWRKIAPAAYLLACCLLIATLIPQIGKEVNGARRWLVILGINLQPAELIKAGVVLFFSSWMVKHQKLLPFLFLTCLPAGLLILQPDLGSALIVLSIAFGLFFLSGARLRYIFTVGAIGVMGIALLILFQPYRLKRLASFLNPELDPLGASFHIRQITLAIGSGKILGQGIGKSRQKFSYIPETSTDSIFAIVAEEIGFVGSLIIVSLWCWLLHVGYQILKKQIPNSFAYLLVGGILLWISSQVILNLASILALVPLTGVPLPYFSYGGSSLVMILCVTGILAQANTIKNPT